uniref:Noggin n=1 Tax=Seriola dumerili TaxID=41447 RepID=A0A3B4T9J5_SERDU
DFYSFSPWFLFCSCCLHSVQAQDEEDTFLQLRASLPSFSQPIRPYTLLTHTEDYHYLPKPRHRRPSHLLRLLGSSFDPFWMSVEQPPEASGGHRDARSLLHGDTLPIKLPTSKENAVRSWLVSSATCELYYQWMDLGPAFWPRWLRQTDCERGNRVQRCSFPSGMECVRAQTTHINILAWHCQEIRDGGNGSRKIKAMKRCLWRQVPYSVVTACTCSCK